ncbi:MAG TPA: TauD/TfdA family dioxygenase [Myxococcota bacterium]
MKIAELNETSARPARGEPLAEMTQSFGLVIQPSEVYPDIAALNDRAAAIEHSLRGCGAVLLRGFGFELASMEELTARFGTRFTSHHATAIGRRERVTETTATVNLGTRPFAWHRERGYAPFAPDLVFFFCERPARTGGETFLSDGCAIFEQLTPSSRDFVSQSSVEYRYPLPRESWPLALGAADEAGAEAALTRMAERLSSVEALSWKFSAEGVKARYRAPMLTSVRWTGRASFCNQVIFRAPRILLGDGSKLPARLLRELQQLADANSYPIVWQRGDLALIDNSRVMHARGQIGDPERRILARMCHVDA